jgi:hypothetical protein
MGALRRRSLGPHGPDLPARPRRSSSAGGPTRFSPGSGEPGTLRARGPIRTVFNTKLKYVALKTLTDPRWANTTVIRGDAAAAVRELKRKPGGKLQVHCSVPCSGGCPTPSLSTRCLCLPFPSPTAAQTSCSTWSTRTPIRRHQAPCLSTQQAPAVLNVTKVRTEAPRWLRGITLAGRRPEWPSTKEAR